MCVTSHTSDSLAQLSRHKRMPQLSHPHESVDYNLGLFSFPYFYRLICGLFKAEIFQIVRIFFFVSEYCISKSYLTHRCWGERWSHTFLKCIYVRMNIKNPNSAPQFVIPSHCPLHHPHIIYNPETVYGGKCWYARNNVGILQGLYHWCSVRGHKYQDMLHQQWDHHYDPESK